jgi:probable F420-dependent oxidoreductase
MTDVGRFGVFLPSYVWEGDGPERARGIKTFARRVEELGFDSLFITDHLLAAKRFYSVNWLEPLISLAVAAGATERVRLGTSILIMPLRNPVILAKELATLDVLSGGRVELGVGVGWLREEFDALGVPWERRGARTDEYIEALRALWRDDQCTFEGEFCRFENAKSFPKPVQGLIPIHVGGHTEAAARRAGRLGDGFFPGRSTDDELRSLLDTMRASAKDAGRDPDAIEVTAGGVMDADGVKRFADLGVDRIALPPLGFDLDTLREQLGRFSEQVIQTVG